MKGIYTCLAEVAILGGTPVHQSSVTDKLPAALNDRAGFTEFIRCGRVDYIKRSEKIYEDTNQKFGTNITAPK